MVAEAWKTVMDRFEGSNTTLVSPATAGNGIEWYDQFFGNCTEMYGPKGCRIGMLATHDCEGCSLCSLVPSTAAKL